MNIRTCHFALLLLLPSLCLAQAAVRGWYMSPENMASNSPGIVQVRINDIETVRLGSRVYTDVSATVIESLQGTAETNIRIRQPGGRHGDLVTWSGPIPDWRVGEAWVFCLAYPEPHGWWTVYGIKQGAFKITPGGAVRDFSGYHFIRPLPVTLDAGAIERLPVEQLKSRLAAAVGREWTPTDHGQQTADGRRQTENQGQRTWDEAAPTADIVTTEVPSDADDRLSANNPAKQHPPTNSAPRTVLIASGVVLIMLLMSILFTKRQRKEPTTL